MSDRSTKCHMRYDLRPPTHTSETSFSNQRHNFDARFQRQFFMLNADAQILTSLTAFRSAVSAS